MKKPSIQQELESRGLFHIRPGLERIQRILHALGDPQERIPSIHIAGTNGKGSVAASLESILRKAGFRTGLYTSPHLLDVTERIQVNRQSISTSDFAEIARLVREAELATQTQLTYFEFTTAMAFLAFQRARTTVNVIETGLGGRLDATNVLKKPALTVITSIGLDHERWLGKTETLIAAEKAGIIKTGVPLVSGVRGEGKAVVTRQARRLKAPLFQIDREFRAEWRSSLWQENRQILRYTEDRPEDYVFGLLGKHQVDNAAVALAAVHSLQNAGWDISDATIRHGLRDVQWPGRFQQIVQPGKAPILLDGAHNPAGTSSLLQTLQESPYRNRRKVLVFGAFQDKDVKTMASQWMGQAGEIHLVALSKERGASMKHLQKAFRLFRGPLKIHSTVESGLRQASLHAKEQEMIVVSGSLYLIGEALKWIAKQKKDLRHV